MNTMKTSTNAGHKNAPKPLTRRERRKRVKRSINRLARVLRNTKRYIDDNPEDFNFKATYFTSAKLLAERRAELARL